MPSLERGQDGGKMHEAIVSKISAATYRIYCRRRHFAPNWNFPSQNGCDGSWRSGYVMETTPVVLMLSSTQRDFFRKIEVMMSAWWRNEMQMNSKHFLSQWLSVSRRLCYLVLNAFQPRGVHNQRYSLNVRLRPLARCCKSDAVIKLDDRARLRWSGGGEEGNMKMKGSIWKV